MCRVGTKNAWSNFLLQAFCVYSIFTADPLYGRWGEKMGTKKWQIIKYFERWLFVNICQILSIFVINFQYPSNIVNAPAECRTFALLLENNTATFLTLGNSKQVSIALA